MIEYKFRDGSRFNNMDVVKVVTELERIRKKTGSITTTAILDSKVLEGAFTWDDKTAAQQHRLTEARRLVGAIIRVPDNDNEPEMRMYANVMLKDGERGYVLLREALRKPDYQNQLLVATKSTLDIWKHKYRDLELMLEVLGVANSIKKAKKEKEETPRPQA